MFDNQQELASLNFLDAAGQPTSAPAFDAPPVWSISNPVAVLQPAANGLSCQLVASAVGSAVVTVSATVGGVAWGAQGNLVVSPGPAVSMALSFGAPSNQAASAPSSGSSGS